MNKTIKTQNTMSTYSQIYIQVIFAVKGRQSLIDPSWEERLYQYITQIVQNKGQKMLAINGIHDHIHFLIGIKPVCCLSDLVREVKKSSNSFINEKKLIKQKFNWQEGFGAFSCGYSQMDMVIKYIMNQKEHHRKKFFRDEYIGFLKSCNILYDEKYLFDWIDESS
jgi:REP element-mobilizing transposase RayT